MNTPVHDRYTTVKREFPSLFANDADLGRIEILTEDAHESAAGPIGVIYEDRYLMLLRDPVRFPDGLQGTYLRLLRKPIGAGGVAILPILNGNLLLLDHYRFACRGRRLEIPRGFAEAGLTPDENARRELHEEVQATADVVTDLGVFEPDTGLSGDITRLFAAKIQAFGRLAVSEGIAAYTLMSPKELEHAIQTGKITDSHTIIAYVRARGLNLI